MKNAFFILVTFFLFIPIKQVKAQQLVQENATWNIGVIGWFNPNWTYSIKMQGDTSFNGLLYKKTYISYDSLNADWTPYNYILREDSLEKVYYRIDYGPEHLLYDFSLVEGDTISTAGCGISVEKVDTIMLDNGMAKKRIKFQSQDIVDTTVSIITYWIEGVGSTSGLFSPLGSHCTTDHLEFLQCYYYDTELAYQNSPTCFYVVGIDEIVESNNVKVYPNPVKSTFKIELDRADWAIEEIKIISTVGRDLGLIKKTNLVNEVDISSLPNGVYYLLVKLNTGQSVSKRILKIDY